MASPFCTACDHENPEGARFCNTCGAPLVGGSPATVVKPAPTSFGSGRYQVVKFLGEGGRKKVYLVHDTLLDREVAFSLIKNEGLDETGMERIRREAQLMARLGEHPHIVPLYDIGQEEGQLYLVTQFMSGGDVEGLIAHSPDQRVPLARTFEVADQVCQALTYAHERGIIHRDLKPGNIWLTRDGTAKLGDFGLAVASDRTRLSVAGMIVGTVAYLPPEQALGRAPDPRADLYSLGATLYELVTGRPPFPGDDPVAIIGQHIHASPVAPSLLAPQIPQVLDTLIVQLLSKDPADRPQNASDVRERLAAMREVVDARAAVIGTAPASVNPLDRLLGGVFVGRETELGLLRAAVDESLSGRPRVALVAGEPGIGKTRLAEEISTYGGLRGATVLWGRCYEWQGAPAYWPWVQAVRDFVRACPIDALRAHLGSWGPDVGAVVAEVRDRMPDLPAPPGLDAEQARFRFFDGFTTFVRSVARDTPLLLVLDDLHWADAPSLLLLQFVAREIQDARLFILGTYRDVELGRHHPLSQTLAELARGRGVTRTALRGLEHTAVVAYIEQTAGIEPPSALVDAIYRETEGNPFFLTEVVRLLASEGKLRQTDEGISWSLTLPQGVREAVGRRLERLSPETNEALTVGALVGRHFALPVLDRVLEQPPGALLEQLDEAVEARLLEESGIGRYRFTHALVQETLLAELSTPRRVRLHAQVGAALEDVYADERDSHLAELAYHYFEAASAGHAETAIRYAREAGRRALEAFGYEEAVGHYLRALQLLDVPGSRDERLSCDVLLELGEAQMWAGQPAGRETLKKAAEVARRLGYGEGLARAALGAMAAVPSPFVLEPEMADVFREAATALEDDDSEVKARLISYQAKTMAWDQRSLETRRHLADESVAMARRLGDPATLAVALANRLHHLAGPDNLDERLEDAGEILRITRTSRDIWMESYGWYALLCASLEQCDRRQADEALSKYLAIAEILRQPHLRGLAYALRVEADLTVGVVESASAPPFWKWIDEEPYGGLGASLTRAYVGYLLRRELGTLGTLEEDVRSAVASDPSDAGWRCRLVVLLFESGKPAEGHAEWALVVRDGLPAVPRDFRFLTYWAMLAEAAYLTGDDVVASLVIPMIEPYANRCVVAYHLGHGPVAMYLGMASAASGDWDQADVWYCRATERAESMGQVVHGTRTMVLHAEALCSRSLPGDHELALDLANKALAVSQEHGLIRLADQALGLKVSLQGILKA